MSKPTDLAQGTLSPLALSGVALLAPTSPARRARRATKVDPRWR